MIADPRHQLPAPPPPRHRDGHGDDRGDARGGEGSDVHPPPQPRRTRGRTVLILAISLVVLFLVLLAVGLIPRLTNSHRLNAGVAQQQNAPQKVAVIHAARTQEADLSLAANTQALQDAIIYARTSGYISKRYVDLGDRVKAGQLLAEILSPEIDQQLRQARADLEASIKNLQQQQANLKFAEVTVNRYKAADKEGAVAKEDLDQRITAYQTASAAVASAEANVNSNRANVARLEQLTSFERVTAPFDGTVTQRNVDVGTLITAGSPTSNNGVAPTSPTGTAGGMFEVAQLDTLRVFVTVPQAFAPNIKVGMGVQIAVRGQLTEPVNATVTRTADALDPGTRTLLTEVDIPNAARKLMPGMFVYVGFKVEPSGSRWRVPSTAVVFNSQGTLVAVIAPGYKVHFQRVVLGRDFGASVDIQSGITPDQWLVKQPMVSLEEGQTIEPEETQYAPGG